MATSPRGTSRKKAVSDHKRNLILDAARRVFEAEGLEGASLRAIAAEAGYTPAALYFHFESREAIYAELLSQSLSSLKEAVALAADGETAPQGRLTAAVLASFDFYARSPWDLDLGFYLQGGGMRPRGLGRNQDERLNAALLGALQPIGDAVRGLGATETAAGGIVADIFGHAVGLLMLEHTRRIRLFDASARTLMERHVDRVAAELATGS